MLKQKLTQREFSKKKKKKKKKPSKQEVQENSYAKEQSLQSCICNFIEITPPHWCSPINLWDTHKHFSEELPWRVSANPQLVKMLKLDFVKRKLFKLKTHEMIVLIDCSC